MSMHRGLSARGLLPGLLACSSLALPSSQPIRWWAVGCAIALFAVVGITLLVIDLRAAQDKEPPRWLVLGHLVMSTTAVTLGGIGGGGVEGNQRFFLLLIVVISASSSYRSQAIVGLLTTNIGLWVSALVVGVEPGVVVALGVNFAGVSIALASVMIYFRRCLAVANKRSEDLGYLAGVSARASSIDSAIAESEATICRVTGASSVLLIKRVARRHDDRVHWIDLGSSSSGKVLLGLTGPEKPDTVLSAAIADIFRPVVAREVVVAELHALSMTDPLCGLANRRGLDEYLEQHCAKVDAEGGLVVRGEQAQVSVVLLDLDHFKLYNDQNGHLAGDQVLRDLGELLGSKLRGSDLAARYGGEEFCLVLNGNPDATPAVLHRLRKQWAEVQPGVRFSAGVAVWDGAESAQDLLERADAALYVSKSSGRDRTTVA